MAEAGHRRPPNRRGPRAAGRTRQAGLVQRSGGGGAAAFAARTAGGLLLLEGAHAERTNDRLGGALPSRQRRAAGADRLAWRYLCEGTARVRRLHGQLSLSPRGYRKEPRGLCQPKRGSSLERGEETAEERRPAAAGHAAVVTLSA